MSNPPRGATDRIEPPPGKVLVACSGGPDSVALSHLAVAAVARVVGLAHVDHQLRPDSAAMGEVVARLATLLGVPFVHRAVSVSRAGSEEDAARQARWTALREMAAATGAAVIATGHTADDQAETVLMRLARGAGTTGVAAMRALSPAPVSGGAAIWRPLLAWRRAVVRELCRQQGWEVVADPSNEDRRYERNRIRLDVLPLLGDRAVTALARAARLAADDDDLLDSLIVEVVVARPDGTAACRLDWLASAPLALARRAVRRAARLAGARYPPPADRVEDALTRPGVSLGGGVRSRREGAWLVVEREPGLGTASRGE